MAEVKLAAWNVEWMNDLFDGRGGFKPDGAAVRGPQSSNTVIERRRDIAGVIDALALDVVVVVEGPNESRELQLFFDRDVQGEWSCGVQPTPKSSQILGIAVRTDGGKFADPPFERFDTGAGSSNLLALAVREFHEDIDRDELLEVHRFERLPIYAEIQLSDGKKFRVVGLHLKSKIVADAVEWARWWSIADANRKRILAQCRRIRARFVDRYLASEDAPVPLILCGDINDGPGFDASERLLGGSGIEDLMGSVWKPDLALGNVLYDALPEKAQDEIDLSSIRTTSYRDPIFEKYLKVWIDHILYTRSHGAWVANGRVHDTMPSGRRIWDEFPHASDHHPVSAVVTI